MASSAYLSLNSRDIGGVQRTNRIVNPQVEATGDRTMPRTIICQQCGAILNLPTHIEPGKRLKCPKCATRFVVTEKDASSASTRPGEVDAATTSKFELPTRPTHVDDLPLPTAEGDLREALDLPLSSAAAEKSVS